MPFNGAGSFTSLGAPTFPTVSGDFILASYFNATMNDVFSGLSSVLPRDGQAAMTANLPMGGFKVTNVGAGAVAGDALMYGQAGAVLAGLTVNTTFAMTGTMTAATGTVNLTGATSVTVPLQAVADDSNKAASTAYVWDFFATMPSGTLPSMVGKSLYNLRVNAGETGVEWALVTPTVTRDARTSNTILGVADQGHLIDVTSGTFSQTFAAVATLGSGWFVWYKNSGTGVVTLDPDGAELINGASTFVLPAGTTSLIQCTGTALTVLTTAPFLRYTAIFSATAATLAAGSSSEVMFNELVATGLSASGAVPNICFGNSLFVAASAASQSNVASSPDNDTYTLRAMPSAAIWQPATNGTTGWVASVPGAVTTAKSVDGTTWVAGTALGGTAHATNSVPAYNGSTALVIASAATTCYTSPDNGATWNAQTLPAASGLSPWVVSGLFVMYNTGTNYYTSATGATGSWTLRALPAAMTTMYQDFDGALLMSTSAGALYRCTDGINWTLLPITLLNGSRPPFTINGVYGVFSDTWGSSGSFHSGKFALRRETVHYFAGGNSYRAAQNTAGTIFAVPSPSALGQVMRIAPGASDAALGLFVG